MGDRRLEAEIAELRASEARYRFLLALDDRLRPLTEPHTIELEGARALAEHFGVATVAGWAERRANLSAREARLVEEANVRIAVAVASARPIAAMRRSEHELVAKAAARDAYRIALSDTLRFLPDPFVIQAEATRILGEHLGANRVLFAEIDGQSAHFEDTYALVYRSYALDVLPINGRFKLVDLGLEPVITQRSRPTVVVDVLDDPTLSEEERARYAFIQVRGWATVPLLKNRQFVAALVVQQSTPRRWTEDELALLEETAERTWAAVERARAMAALAVSEERLRLAIDVAGLGTFSWDLATNVGYLDERAAEMVNLPAGRLDGVAEAQFSVIHPDDIPRVSAAVVSGMSAKTAFSVAYRVRRRDGGERHISSWLRPVLDDEGNVTGFTGTNRDVTADYEVLEAATRARAAAESANRAKDEFLAMLSHELRTPIAAILLWANAARADGVSASSVRRALDAVVQSAQSQSRLVEDLLDLTRLTSGRLFLAVRSSDIRKMAQAAIDVVHQSADAKRISLVLDIPHDLGNAVLDPDRMGQVLWNLLSNSIKFTGEGGHVTLKIRKVEQILEIVVTDDGDGIDPSFLPHVFERFRQADMGDTRQHSGLGIGLALSRNFTALHGGTIEAESAGLGRGATFRVHLPWRDGMSNGAARGDKQAAKRQLRGVRVLLVEDDPQTRAAMQYVLEAAGAEVRSTASATEALAMVHGSNGTAPEVIVADLALPELTGYELMERIVERARARGEAPPPACAVSAHVREDDRMRAIESGFDFYLAKPIAADELVAAVQDLREIAEAATS